MIIVLTCIIAVLITLLCITLRELWGCFHLIDDFETLTLHHIPLREFKKYKGTIAAHVMAGKIQIIFGKSQTLVCNIEIYKD